MIIISYCVVHYTFNNLLVFHLYFYILVNHNRQIRCPHLEEYGNICKPNVRLCESFIILLYIIALEFLYECAVDLTAQVLLFCTY